MAFLELLFHFAFERTLTLSSRGHRPEPSKTHLFIQPFSGIAVAIECSCELFIGLDDFGCGILKSEMKTASSSPSANKLSMGSSSVGISASAA
jgi:hypothetical protein